MDHGNHRLLNSGGDHGGEQCSVGDLPGFSEKRLWFISNSTEIVFARRGVLLGGQLLLWLWNSSYEKAYATLLGFSLSLIAYFAASSLHLWAVGSGWDDGMRLPNSCSSGLSGRASS